MEGNVLLPPEEKQRLPITKGDRTEELIIYLKFFVPHTLETWYVAGRAGDESDGDVLLYGIISDSDERFGWFSLREMEAKGACQDIDWSPRMAREVLHDIRRR